ncbi:MAG: DUF427 domain-containing protein [Chloroflexi bacterium]|nr:DUF427 domain-containing protein [Chloroflexota bacterium]
MAKAVWNGVVLAESDQTVMVEGNHYFPPESLNREYFTDSSFKTTCPWKGLANYYSLEVNGQANKDAAWVYRDPKTAAEAIRDHVAFSGSVEVID